MFDQPDSATMASVTSEATRGPDAPGVALVDPRAPHWFAKLMDVGFTAIASVLLFAAPALSLPALAPAGYAVAVLAGVAAGADVCVGCRMYRQVSFFRRLGVVCPGV